MLPHIHAIHLLLHDISQGQPGVSSKKTEMCLCVYVCGIEACNDPSEAFSLPHTCTHMHISVSFPTYTGVLH